MPGCLACNSAGCTLCDTDNSFSLNSTTLLCDCQIGSYIGPMKHCVGCTMKGCIDCKSKDICLQCDLLYFTLNPTTQFCDEICGDGFLFTVLCDDGNTVDGDGCSSTCAVEDGWQCAGGDAVSKSLCSYSLPILMQLTKTLKKSL